MEKSTETITKLCRNYLFAYQESPDGQYGRKLMGRLESISAAEDQLLEALVDKPVSQEVESETALQAIKDCRKEIQSQLKMLDDEFTDNFASYCRKNGLEIEKEEIYKVLQLSFGMESRLYNIYNNWAVIGLYAQSFISQINAAWPDKDIQMLHSMREKIISCFMDIYQLKEENESSSFICS